MSSREETTGPVRMPNGVRDYLERGTTPVELAEAECAAAADPDGGRSCEAAVRRQGLRGRIVTDRIIEDLPGGWRGVIHDLAVTLKLAEPAPGEREAMQEMEAGQ